MYKFIEKGNFKKPRPFIRPGIRVLQITDITLENYGKEDYKAVIHAETEPITEQDWEGFEGAKGQIGRIGVVDGRYLKNDELKLRFVNTLRDIATALGKFDEISSVEAETLEDLVAKVKPILIGGGYARYFVRGQEYAKPNSEIGKGIKLMLPSRNPVESISIDPAHTTLEKFDFENKWHYEKLVRQTTQVDPLFSGNTSDFGKDELPI